MAGMMRAAVVIGAIALFSPVHNEDPAARIDAMRDAPRQAMQAAIASGPQVAGEAFRHVDHASRMQLARLAVLALAGEGTAAAPTRP